MRARAAEAAALAALALGIRVLRALQIEVIFNDGPQFVGIARNLAAGSWSAALAHDYHPLYPGLMALLHPLTGDWVLSGVAVSVVAGTLAVWVAYAWLDAAVGRVPARVGAFALAVHPYAIDVSADVMSDGLHLLLFLCAVALGWRALQQRGAGGAALGCGLAAGGAYLVRPEGAGVALAVAGVAALEALRGRLAPRALLRLGAALGVGCLLVMTPYVSWLSAERGELTFSQKKSINALLGVERLRDWLGHAPDPDPALAPAAAGPAEAPEPNPLGGDLAVGPPVAAALVEVLETSLSVLRYEVALLLILGLVAARWPPGLRGRYHAVLIALYLVVLTGLLANVGYLSRRHALPAALSTLPYVALGAVAAASWLARPLRRAGGRGAAWTLLLLLVAGLGLGKAFRTPDGDALAERRAAEWLRANHAPVARVAAVKQRVAFYADAPFADLRLAPGGTELLPSLRAAGARWLVVDSEEDAVLEALAGGALERVHREEVRGEVAYVYALPR